MVDCFRLTPRDLSHTSWKYSITTKTVFILAYDEKEARRRVANTLYNGVIPPNPPKYQKIMPPPSPWEIADATSCEKEGGCSYGNHVVADDGEKWPTRF
jgi:hypothetical protein